MGFDQRRACAWIGLTAIGVSLGAATPIGAEGTRSGPMGRTLEQSVTAGAREFTVCVGFRNPDYTGYYLTVGLQNQMEISFTDERGVVDLPNRIALPGSRPPPPPSESPSAYMILEGHTKIEACRSFEYNGFSADRLHIRSTFRSWLGRDAELPETVRRMAINERLIGRPLYQDEPVASNVCVLNRRSRRVRCH